MMIKYRKAGSEDAELLTNIYNASFYSDYMRFGTCPGYGKTKATPHDPRLTPLHIICLPAFRHITQILLDLRQQACVGFRQSDENLDGASDAQGSCGVAFLKGSSYL